MTTGESSSHSSSLHLYGDLSTVVDIDTKKLLSSSDAFSDRIPGFSRSYSSSSNFDGRLSHYPNSVPFQLIKNDLQDVINRSAVLSTLVNKGENLAFSLNTTARTELEVLDEIRLQVGERSTEVASEAQAVITRVKDRLVSQAKVIAENHLEEVHEIEDLVAKVSARTDDLARNMGRSLKSGLSATYQGLKRLYSDVVEFETKLGLLPEALSDDIESRYGRERTLPKPSLDPRLNFSIRNSSSSNRSTLIGIIDSGFNAANPDIDPSRLILGQDRIDQDANPLIKEGEGSEHGTAMLGIIGATQHNGIGIDGINATSPIWLGRAIGSGKVAASIAEFVDYAKQAGYKNSVLNLSMDLTQTNADGSVSTRTKLTDQERAAIAYAKQNHVIVVVAAGNNGGAVSSWNQVAQDFDNIVLVGSADGDQRATYSDTGAGLSLVASGGTVDNPVISTMHNGIGKVAGTSVASARVTGAVSLLQASNPDLNYRQVIDILEGTAQDIGTTGFDTKTGNGLLNAAKAIILAEMTKSETLYESVQMSAWTDWQRGMDGMQASEREANLWGDIGNTFNNVVNDVGKTANTIKIEVDQAKNKVIDTVKPVVDEGAKQLDQAKNKVIDVVKPIVDEGTKQVGQAKNKVIDVVKPIVDEGAKQLDQAKNKVIDTVKPVVNEGAKQVDQAKNKIIAVAKSVVDERTEQISQAKNNSIDTMELIIDEGIKKASQVKNEVVDSAAKINNFIDNKKQEFVSELETSRNNISQAVSQGFSDGMKSLKELESSTLQDFKTGEFKILWGDTSEARKPIRDVGSAMDKTWDNVYKEMVKYPILNKLAFDIDVTVGATKSVLETADGLLTMNDFFSTHSPRFYMFHPHKFREDMHNAAQVKEYISANPNILLEVGGKIPGAIWDGVSQPYAEALKKGRLGQAGGRFAVDFGSMFIGLGEIGTIGKAGKVGRSSKLVINSVKGADKLTDTSKATKIIDKIPSNVDHISKNSTNLPKLRETLLDEKNVQKKSLDAVERLGKKGTLSKEELAQSQLELKQFQDKYPDRISGDFPERFARKAGKKLDQRNAEAEVEFAKDLLDSKTPLGEAKKIYGIPQEIGKDYQNIKVPEYRIIDKNDKVYWAEVKNTQGELSRGLIQRNLKDAIGQIRTPITDSGEVGKGYVRIISSKPSNLTQEEIFRTVNGQLKNPGSRGMDIIEFVEISYIDVSNKPQKLIYRVEKVEVKDIGSSNSKIKQAN